MEKAPIPADESDRQAAVDRMKIIDTPSEERFNQLTEGATKDLQAPISTISIIDKDREWFKSSVGLEKTEAPRESSFCGHTIVRGKLFVVEDTKEDTRFKDNPQVTEPPHIRFYAGVTMHDHKTHQPIGAFCIKDTKPRQLSLEELNTLLEYAHKAEVELNRSVEPGAIPTDAEKGNSTEKSATPLWRQLIESQKLTSC